MFTAVNRHGGNDVDWLWKSGHKRRKHCRKNGTQTEQKEENNEKEKVVVACWGNQMLDSYTQYLCDLFPQV